MSLHAAPAKPILPRLAAYRRLLLLATAVFLADQASKGWVARRLPFGTYGEDDGAITVIRGFCYIVHVWNTGAAWSLFSGRYGNAVFAGLAVATLVAIFLWRRTLEVGSARGQVCFGLLCGGITGNLADRLELFQPAPVVASVGHGLVGNLRYRLAHGHVVDFIDLHFGSYVYPTFNVADAGICVGVALYLLASLIPRSPSAPGRARAHS